MCSVEYSVFLIKKKKKLSGTKVCNLQTLRYCPVTSLYDITRVPSACFLELGIGGLASAETMHRIGLLNKNLITYVLQKTAESGEILIWCCLRDGD